MPSGTGSLIQLKLIAKIDPTAQSTRAKVIGPDSAYATNCLIETKRMVIMGVEARRAIRQAAVGRSHGMLDRSEKRFGTKLEKLAAAPASGPRNGHTINFAQFSNTIRCTRPNLSLEASAKHCQDRKQRPLRIETYF